MALVFFHEHTLRISQEIGDRREAGLALNNLGMVYEDLNNQVMARLYYEKAQDIYQQIGDKRGEGLSTLRLGDVSHYLGDYGLARVCYEQALQIYQEIDHPYQTALTQASLSLLWLHLGNHNNAQELADLAFQVGCELYDQTIQGIALLRLGQAATAADKYLDATVFYKQAYDIWQTGGRTDQMIAVLVGLAQVSLRQGEFVEAQARAISVLELFEDPFPGRYDEAVRAYLVCYQVFLTNDDPRSEAALGHAYRLLQEQAAQWQDEGARHLYLHNIAVHREVVEAYRRGKQA